MPTGYTHDITTNPNLTARAFILRCARAFGACVAQRDEDTDVPPRHREMGTYEAECAKKAQAAVAESSSITLEQAAVLARADFNSNLKRWRESQERKVSDRCRYLEMREQIEAWVPPTEDHAELRKFMLSQIDESIRFDCDYDWPAPTPKTSAEWLAARKQNDVDELARAEKGLADETERVRKANAWIEALYVSLPAAVEKETSDGPR
jgi:hypothetical protein